MSHEMLSSTIMCELAVWPTIRTYIASEGGLLGYGHIDKVNTYVKSIWVFKKQTGGMLQARL